MAQRTWDAGECRGGRAASRGIIRVLVDWQWWGESSREGGEGGSALPLRDYPWDE